MVLVIYSWKWGIEITYSFCSPVYFTLHINLSLLTKIMCSNVYCKYICNCWNLLITWNFFHYIMNFLSPVTILHFWGRQAKKILPFSYRTDNRPDSLSLACATMREGWCSQIQPVPLTHSQASKYSFFPLSLSAGTSLQGQTSTKFLLFMCVCRSQKFPDVPRLQPNTLIQNMGKWTQIIIKNYVKIYMPTN